MHILRTILLYIASTLLTLSLFSFGALYSVRQTLGSPDTLKEALDKSGIYDVAIQEALGQVEKSNTSSTDNIPVSNPEIQAVIQQSIPPSLLKEQAETGLDSVYDWLQGRTDQLVIAFDLRTAKSNLAQNLGSYTQKRLSSLPTCTSLSDLTATVDPFTATCLPPNFNVPAAAQKVRTDIESNQDFLKDPVVTSQTPVGDSGETLGQKLQELPSIYEQVIYALYLSGGLIILCTFGVIFLHREWRRGLKRVSILFISIGALSAILSFIAGLLLTKASSMVTQENGGVLQSKAVEAVTILTADLRKWWLIYGLSLVAMGLAALFASRFTVPNHPHAHRSRREDLPVTPVDPPTPAPPTTLS